MHDAVWSAYGRIRPLVRETPVEYSDELGAWLKLELLQTTGSFKFRGAANRIALLAPEDPKAGVVAASNGNHGMVVATAAQARGIAAEVFVSAQVSPAKARRIERLGARLRRAGADPLDAELAARRAAAESGRVFISPYNDRDVMAGQGTIAVELLRQLPKIDAVFVAVGGGGLAGGNGAYLRQASPETEIVGCWPENSPVLYECMRAGRIVEVREQPTLSESTAGGLEPGSVTLDVCRDVIRRAVLVSESEIAAAMRLVLETGHWLIEGAAAVAVAFRKDAERWRGKSVGGAHARQHARPQRRHSRAGAAGDRPPGHGRPHHGRSDLPLHLAPALQHAADDDLRGLGALPGGDRNLRPDGLLGGAAHAGDRYPHGAGAGGSAIERMVVIQGMRLAVTGVVVGLAGAFGLTRLLSAFLFGVRERAPAVFTGVAVVLL